MLPQAALLLGLQPRPHCVPGLAGRNIAHPHSCRIRCHRVHPRAWRLPRRHPPRYAAGLHPTTACLSNWNALLGSSCAAAECIPGYPDANLPTVLLYRDTKCVQTLVGLRHFGGRSTSPELVSGCVCVGKCRKGGVRSVVEEACCGWNVNAWSPGVVCSSKEEGLHLAGFPLRLLLDLLNKHPFAFRCSPSPGGHQLEPIRSGVRRRGGSRGTSARPDQPAAVRACGAAAGRRWRRRRRGSGQAAAGG